jgi:thiamine biosynthesis protein ThiS
MRIYVNGEKRDYDKKMTVSDLLSELSLDQSKVAIEINLSIIPRSLYEKTEIHESDQIEIVHFIGGGE